MSVTLYDDIDIVFKFYGIFVKVGMHVPASSERVSLHPVQVQPSPCNRTICIVVYHVQAIFYSNKSPCLKYIFLNKNWILEYYCLVIVKKRKMKRKQHQFNFGQVWILRHLINVTLFNYVLIMIILNIYI